MPSPGGVQSPDSKGARSAGEKARCLRRLPLLLDHAAVAERLGFTDTGVLARSSSFLTDVLPISVLVNHEPLDRTTRLSAVHRRRVLKRRGEDSHALSVKRNAGECWYMDWTRKFDDNPNKNKYGLVCVESKTWLLRARFFQDKSADRLVESIG